MMVKKQSLPTLHYLLQWVC